MIIRNRKSAKTLYDRMIERMRQLQAFAHATYMDYLDLYNFCCKLADTYESGDKDKVNEMLDELADILDEDYPCPY